jgi:hypothetical protein
MIALLVPSAALLAQTTTGTANKTPWGDPDLQGIWDGKTQTPLQRPVEFADREFLTDEEVATLERQARENPGRDTRPERGSLLDVAEAYNNIWSSSYGGRVVRTKRTSLIVDPPDGKLPPLTSDGQKRVDADREFVRVYGRVSETGPGGPADNPEDRPQDRCRGVSLPCIGALCAFSRIVQTPGLVTIYFESGHHGGIYRRIPLDGQPHLPPSVRQWLGDARGRWEGDTLVVDTTNFTGQTSFQGSTEHLHLVERFTRTAPDLILYRATIEDATVFTKPWTFEMTLTLRDNKENQIFEAACHEGNYAMTNVLSGARVSERSRR